MSPSKYDQVWWRVQGFMTARSRYFKLPVSVVLALGFAGGLWVSSLMFPYQWLLDAAMVLVIWIGFLFSVQVIQKLTRMVRNVILSIIAPRKLPATGLRERLENSRFWPNPSQEVLIVCGGLLVLAWVSALAAIWYYQAWLGVVAIPLLLGGCWILKPYRRVIHLVTLLIDEVTKPLRLTEKFIPYKQVKEDGRIVLEDGREMCVALVERRRNAFVEEVRAADVERELFQLLRKIGFSLGGLGSPIRIITWEEPTLVEDHTLESLTDDEDFTTAPEKYIWAVGDRVQAEDQQKRAKARLVVLLFDPRIKNFIANTLEELELRLEVLNHDFAALWLRAMTSSEPFLQSAERMVQKEDSRLPPLIPSSVDLNETVTMDGYESVIITAKLEDAAQYELLRATVLQLGGRIHLTLLPQPYVESVLSLAWSLYVLSMPLMAGKDTLKRLRERLKKLTAEGDRDYLYKVDVAIQLPAKRLKQFKRVMFNTQTTYKVQTKLGLRDSRSLFLPWLPKLEFGSWDRALDPVNVVESFFQSPPLLRTEHLASQISPVLIDRGADLRLLTVPNAFQLGLGRESGSKRPYYADVLRDLGDMLVLGLRGTGKTAALLMYLRRLASRTHVIAINLRPKLPQWETAIRMLGGLVVTSEGEEQAFRSTVREALNQKTECECGGQVLCYGICPNCGKPNRTLPKPLLFQTSKQREVGEDAHLVWFLEEVRKWMVQKPAELVSTCFLDEAHHLTKTPLSKNKTEYTRKDFAISALFEVLKDATANSLLWVVATQSLTDLENQLGQFVLEEFGAKLFMRVSSVNTPQLLKLGYAESTVETILGNKDRGCATLVLESDGSMLQLYVEPTAAEWDLINRKAKLPETDIVTRSLIPDVR